MLAAIPREPLRSLHESCARLCVWRAQAIIFPPAFERIAHHENGSRSVAAKEHATWSWLMTSSSVGAGVLMVREITHARIERTGARDAKNAHLGPLAKRAGARCAF